MLGKMKDGPSDLGAVAMTLSEDVGFKIASYVEHLKLPEYLYPDFVEELAACLIERRQFSDPDGRYEVHRTGMVAETNDFLKGLRNDKTLVMVLKDTERLLGGTAPKSD